MLAAGLLPRTAAAGPAAGPLFAIAFMDRDRRYGVALLSERGEIVHREALPGRGHGFAAHPRWLLAFARRPGLFAVAFDRTRASPPQAIAAASGRHFFGHGVFSADGRLLYAAENDFEAGRGVIGVYDAAAEFRRLGEFPSGGIDPHDMALLEGGKVLVVANGGILTHPQSGRAKLNLATMEPSVAFVRLPAGELLENQRLPAEMSRLSLRHMAIDGKGRAWVGAQWEGEQGRSPPLAFFFARGETPVAAGEPREGWALMRDYVGSVAASPDGALIAFSAPEANRALVVDAATGRSAGWIEQPRLYAVAGKTGGAGFLTASDRGSAGEISHPLAWDNHMLRLD